MKDFNKLKTVCLVLVSLSLIGCGTFGTYNPATGRKEFVFISTSEEVSMGRDIHQKILQQYELSDDKGQLSHIQTIGQRLTQVSDRQDYQYHFYLIEKDELNAFTTPGGNIYVFTGLMDKLSTDEQIAAVLSHEIGHCAAKHTIKKFQVALGYNLLGSILLSQVEAGQAREIVNLSSGAIMNLVFSSYSRKDEFEADRLGIKYMHLVKYDLQGMIDTLTVLEKASKGPKIPTILRTHPHLSERIGAVNKEISLVQNKY